MEDRANRSKMLPLMLPMRCVIFWLVFTVGAFAAGRTTAQISHWWSVIASLVNIITILILLFLTKKQGSSYGKLINYQKGRTTGWQIAGMSFVILLVGMAGMYLAGLFCYGVIPYAAPMMIAPIPAWLAAVNLAVLPISTALAEEGLYLGCGVNQIKSKYMAVLIPAFFFALQHSFIPTLFDIKYMIYRFLSFLPLTVLLCAQYHKKRNPLPIMVGHTLIDVATAAQILATSCIPGLYEKMCG